MLSFGPGEKSVIHKSFTKGASKALVFAVLKLLTHAPASLPPVPTSIKQRRCVGSAFSALRPIVGRSFSAQNPGCRQR